MGLRLGFRVEGRVSIGVVSTYTNRGVQGICLCVMVESSSNSAILLTCV